jgi:hypothetical protein
VAVQKRPGLVGGANCQLFAYEVLEHFGLRAPPLRSGELWADRDSTVRVETAQPLDLLLFGATDDAYGAHIGVWAGAEEILHLCAEVGRPAVWGPADFAARERYRVVIGIKRVIKTPGAGRRRRPSAPGGDFEADDDVAVTSGVSRSHPCLPRSKSP